MSTGQRSDRSDFKFVRIPAELYEKLAIRLVGSSFGSVDEWVVKLIESEFQSRSFSEAEEAEVKKRLQSLGYE